MLVKITRECVLDGTTHQPGAVVEVSTFWSSCMQRTADALPTPASEPATKKRGRPRKK